MTPLVNGNGFATIGTPDLDATVDFYTEICRFVVSETRDDEVFLTGNSRHHWVRLVRSDAPGVILIGFDAVNRGSLQEVASRLEKLGVARTPGGIMAADRIPDGIRFRGRWGLEIDVYEEMLDVPTLAGCSDAGLEDLLHSVVTVGDGDQGEEFYNDVL